jgi:thiamine transporter
MSQHLLSFLRFADIVPVSEETTDVVFYVTLGVVAALAVVAAVLSLANREKTRDTRSLVFAAVCIAASFALSFIKVGMPYGGSVTLASLVPILVYSYFFGPVKGLLAGLVYSLLQFLQEPYILTPLQVILDYPLAFCAIALMGIFKRVLTEKPAVICGVAAVFLVRLTMHLFAGMLFFEAGWVADGLPADSAFIYSLLYNLSYLAPDIAIVFAAMLALLYTGSFRRLADIAVPGQYRVKVKPVSQGR